MYSGECAGLHLSAFYTERLWEVFEKMKKSYEMDMCTGPLLKKLLIFAVPLILSGVLQLLFNAADIVVVGKFAGSHALAAVGSTGALINLFTNVFIGFSIGANVLVAQYFGAKDEQNIQDTVHTSMAIGIIGGMFLIVAGMIFAPMMLEVMATPEEVLGQAALYIRIYFIGMPAMLIYNFGAAVLRAIGDTRRPLYYLLEAGVVNVILNLVFVIGFQMGVAGVAIATVVSQCISAALIVRCLMKSGGMYRLYLKRIRIHKEKMIRIIQIGLPAGLQGAIFSISNVLIQSSINSFGAIAMAGNTAASNIEGFVYVSMNAIYQTALSFVSQNVGAGQQKRIPKISIYCMAIVFTVGLALGTLAYRCGGTLLGIYSSDPEVIVYGLDRIWSGSYEGHLPDLFSLRNDGRGGRYSARYGIFYYADAGISCRCLWTANRVDLYCLCMETFTVCPVPVVSDYLDHHTECSSDLLCSSMEKKKRDLGDRKTASGSWKNGGITCV